MSARYLLAGAAVALILALAGCGGGGGGGGSVVVTADVTGKVVNEAGAGIVGATVSIDTVTRAPITTTTGAGGVYTLQGVPVGTDLELTIYNPFLDATQVYRNIQVNAPSGGVAPMDIVFTQSTPPVGSTASIVPQDTEIATGTSPEYSVEVDTGGGVLQYYPAIWSITGAQGSVSENGEKFIVVPGQAGSTVTLRAMVLMQGGDVLTVSRTMTVVNPDGGGGPPPPPQ